MRDETAAKQNRTDGLNASVPWRVIDVQVLPDYALAVRFADGTEGEVDLSRLVLGQNVGVFAALRDRAVFAQAAVEDGVVTWPGDLDLAPNAATFHEGGFSVERTTDESLSSPHI